MTVKKPVDRIVLACGATVADPTMILKVNDKVVGVPDGFREHEAYTAYVLFPGYDELPSVGKCFSDADVNIEAIAALEPDLVICCASYEATLAKLEEIGIPAFGMGSYNPAFIDEDIQSLGYIFGKRAEAEAYHNFRKHWLDEVQNKVAGLSDADKPLVYTETHYDYMAYAQDSWAYNMSIIAGGRNIAAGIYYGLYVRVDPEWVVKEDPDIILKAEWYTLGYTVDDLSDAKAVREESMSRPELASVKAVRNDKFYLYGGIIPAGDFITILYFAKWFYPDLFEELDPEAVHQEFLDRFFEDANFNVYEHGVFVYPEPC